MQQFRENMKKKQTRFENPWKFCDAIKLILKTEEKENFEEIKWKIAILKKVRKL